MRTEGIVPLMELWKSKYNIQENMQWWVADFIGELGRVVESFGMLLYDAVK